MLEYLLLSSKKRGQVARSDRTREQKSKRKNMGTKKEADLDDLLDSALEDLEEQEKEQASRPISQPTPPPKSTPTPSSPSPSPAASTPYKPPTPNNNNIATNNTTTEDEAAFTQFEEEITKAMNQLPPGDMEEMKKLMGIFQSGDIEKTISEMQKLVMTDKSNPPTSSFSPVPSPAPSPNRDSSSSSNSNNNNSASLTENMANTLQSLADSAKKIESQLPGDMDPSAMEKLLEQFESNKEFQAAMEGMVQQLVAKDTLYDPMRELREKYPGWLKANEKTLSEEDYRRYIKQYECVQKICTCYETNTGDSYQDIVTLMQEMADSGQPPPEIISELAPGVQFGADGMPILPGQDGNNPQCSIM